MARRCILALGPETIITRSQNAIIFQQIMTRSARFCFTTNNYTAATVALFSGLIDREDVSYLVFGREVAPETGTPHLQGYVEFSARRAIGRVRDLLTRSHVEVARGSPEQCSQYCKKDGDYEEFGELSRPVGRPNSFDVYREWLEDYDGRPCEREIATRFTSLYVRNRSTILSLRDLICPPGVSQDGEYRDWQTELRERLDAEPADDRSIEFIVDEEGGKGKSWFIRKYLSQNADSQFLSIGKKDDLAYAVKETTRVFLINVPRKGMEFLNYNTLEQIKDRTIFSGKYESTSKVLMHNPHVVVFSNEMPDMEALTGDRFHITEL